MVSGMFHVRFIFIIFSVIVWEPCGPQYVTNTNTRMIAKVRQLAAEMVADAEMKIVAIQFYRDQYYKSIAFQLGEMVYHMRNKFKRMIFLYQQTNKNISYSHYNHNQNIPTMIVMYQMSMDIDNTAHMIEEWQAKREKTEQFHERMDRVMRTGADRNDFKRDVDRMKRLARTGTSREPAPHARPRPAKGTRIKKKKNKKWRHIVDDDFV